MFLKDIKEIFNDINKEIIFNVLLLIIVGRV